jgi:hypothetical protein
LLAALVVFDETGDVPELAVRIRVQRVTESGREWQRVAESGREWQRVAESGRERVAERQQSVIVYRSGSGAVNYVALGAVNSPFFASCSERCDRECSPR